MEALYGPHEWPAEENLKHKDMVSPDARYIFVREDCSSNERKETEASNRGLWAGEGNPVVAFVHYRFVLEYEVPALFVYEIQLEKLVQGRGLGEFLMQLLEIVACKVCFRNRFTGRFY